MFIIAYPVDAQFLQNDLVDLAQQTPKFRQLHDLLRTVCAHARVQLALRHDLTPGTSQAAKRGAPALPANVTVCLAVVRRLMSWSYRTVTQEVNAVWAGAGCVNCICKRLRIFGRSRIGKSN